MDIYKVINISTKLQFIGIKNGEIKSSFVKVTWTANTLSRFKLILDEIIGSQQTGYVPGRFIGINLRKMIDIIMYAEREKIPSAFVSVDFEKCFDTIEHEALFQSLKYFNFGDKIISWVKFVYTNFTLCVISNGKLSPYFKQTRGVHQGCGLSGPLFLCVAETLSHLIKTNEKIKGIQIGDVEEKMGQYADDTGIFSLLTSESIQSVIDELDKFYLNTGLKVN